MPEKYEGQERRGWHIKKEISLGDVLAFTSAGLAVVYAYTTLDKRIALLEEAKVVQVSVDNRQEQDFIRYQQRIDETLKSIDRKVDKLMDRR